jgi:DNA-binding response OmpR family regulator
VKTILIIEDDISILLAVKDTLEFEGYKILSETNGKKGMKSALQNNIDLILLDIMLPDMNGYEICNKVKHEKPDVPIIMISARGTEIDKISGLDIGADDYLTKPFSIPELMARVRAIFRRFVRIYNTPDKYSFGSICLDFKNFRAFKNNKEITLSMKEFSLMEYFIKHEGEAIRRDDMLSEVWDYKSIPLTRTVDNFVLNLRKKLEKNPSNPKHILTIKGVGYRFNSLKSS